MKTAKRIILTLPAWLLGFPAFACCCLLIVLVSLISRGRLLEAVLKFSCRLVLLLCGIRTKWDGLEHFDPGRQYLIMMNHVNFLDTFVFYARFPGRARALEEESHFSWPLYGAMLRRIGMIPINRRQPAQALKNLEKSADLILKVPGQSIVIMPEGTRSRDGRLGPFKRGGFLLALQTGLEILPVVQQGAHDINRKGSLLINPGRVKLEILAPIATREHSRRDLDKLLEKTRKAFLSKLGE